MNPTSTVTICGHTLHGANHICAFFDSSDQQYDIMLPFFSEGLTQHEQILAIADRANHPDHRKRAKAHGIEVEIEEASGSYKLADYEESYLRDQRFAAESMYDFVEQALIDAKAQGYRALRACGDMSWALSELEGTDQLIEYEARLNLLHEAHNHTLICAYDVNSFSGRTLLDVLSTHPLVILNGKLHENPYYQPPLSFLKDLLRRDSAPLARIPA